MKSLLYIISVLLVLTSCFHGKSREHDALPEDSISDGNYDEAYLDSISFYTSHHYTNNFNFLVSGDSLQLFTHEPEELTLMIDSERVVVKHGEDIVVAAIRIVPQDTIDSVWVKVAHDESRMGWVRETEMLPNVSPSDPISQFITIFSNAHLLLTLIVIVVIALAYIGFIAVKHRARIVQLNDIASFYPTALLLVVALAATFYSSIQLFLPELWRHFYYHPTLNPLSVPPLLGIFLTMVWLLPIAAIAAIDDVFHHLHFGEAVLYCFGLGGMCLVVYIVFSVSTLYYIGYPILVAYVIYSTKMFYRRKRLKYFCGACGRAIKEKGKCPHCGAVNE